MKSDSNLGDPLWKQNIWAKTWIRWGDEPWGYEGRECSRAEKTANVTGLEEECAQHVREVASSLWLEWTGTSKVHKIAGPCRCVVGNLDFTPVNGKPLEDWEQRTGLIYLEFVGFFCFFCVCVFFFLRLPWILCIKKKKLKVERVETGRAVEVIWVDEA